MWAFSGGTGVLWAGGAAYRMITEDPITYAPLFLTGMFFLTITAQAVLVDPEHDRAEVL
jgi:cellulose synthase (UDP-forming)